MATKISDLINPTVRDVVPWSEGTEYIVDRIVLVGNSLLKCIQTHTSSPSVTTDIQGSKWFTISPFPMTKAEREAILSPINGTQILQTDDIPYVYTYLNGNWMLQNYTASLLRMVTSAKQVPAVNTSIKFNVVEASLGNAISYNSSTGVFTLQPGGIFEYKGGLGTCYSGSTGGWISSSWQKSTDGTNWSNCGAARIDLTNTNAWSHVPNITDTGGILEATQITYLRYIPTSVNTVSQIGDNSILTQVGTNQYCWAEIKEMSRSSNFKVTLETDTIDVSKVIKAYGSVSVPESTVQTSSGTNWMAVNFSGNQGATNGLTQMNNSVPFTILKDGVYLINAAVHMDYATSGTTNVYSQLLKNGSAYGDIYRVFGDADHTIVSNATILLLAGDTVGMQVKSGNSAAGVTVTGANMSILQIA